MMIMVIMIISILSDGGNGNINIRAAQHEHIAKYMDFIKALQKRSIQEKAL